MLGSQTPLGFVMLGDSGAKSSIHFGCSERGRFREHIIVQNADTLQEPSVQRQIMPENLYIWTCECVVKGDAQLRRVVHLVVMVWAVGVHGWGLCFHYR